MEGELLLSGWAFQIGWNGDKEHSLTMDQSLITAMKDERRRIIRNNLNPREDITAFHRIYVRQRPSAS